MLQIDLALRRLLRRIKEALPGPTTASRLMRRPPGWRNVPLHQRAAAYAQFMHTQQQLRTIHVGQKIAPKIINILFIGLRLHVRSAFGQLILLIVIASILCSLLL
jgi:hypothetical protein